MDRDLLFNGGSEDGYPEGLEQAQRAVGMRIFSLAGRFSSPRVIARLTEVEEFKRAMALHWFVAVNKTGHSQA
jgi:hypothetical protein